MASPRPRDQPLNAVYYPSWRIYKGLSPANLQLDFINRIYYAFVLPNPDGTLRSLDEYADNEIEADGVSGCIAATAQVKQHHGDDDNNNNNKIELLFSIGGGTGSGPFPELASSESSRETFARSCRELVDAHGFDGVDIDWEHPDSPVSGADYLALLRTLREHLPSPQYLLTTALPVGEWVLQHVDLHAASGFLDGLNLMSYDFAGSWTEVAGHHAQLLAPCAGGPVMEEHHPILRTSAHAGVEYVVSRGFPREKLVFGVPAYARTFAGARAVGQPFGEAAEIDYVDLPTGWIHGATVDEETGAAWYLDEEGDGEGEPKGLVSFDVPQTVRRKGAYARLLGLGGLFYWTGAGDVVGPESLVKAGYDGLRSV